MVAPVTGPFVKYPGVSFGDAFQRGYKQAKPFDLPLEYKFYCYNGRSTSVDFDGYTGKTTTYGPTKDASWNLATSESTYASKRNHCYNTAYERLRSELAPGSAGWAENFAQIQKTRRSIVERSMQLATFATALKKCDFKKAAKVLRTPVPSGVSNRKAVAQNFLEWEYGIKPLLSDLEESMKVLCSDPAPRTIRGSARDRIQYVTTTNYSSSTYIWRETTAVSGVLRLAVRTNYRITNPNLFLANQLGVIDIALPWKLIPFSFVVDWFVNVEQVLSSVSDWYGITLSNPSYTEYSKGVKYFLRWATSKTMDPKPWSVSNITRKYESVQMDRKIGIPSPTLTVKPFRGFSVNRGAQAISLVLATLGK